MNGAGATFVLSVITAVVACGQSGLPVKAEAPKTPLHATNAPQVAVPSLPEELTVTGLIDLPSYQRVFLKIEMPGQPARYQTLAKDAPSGEVTLLAIDSHKNKVTVRHRGSVRELWLNTRTGELSVPPTTELKRDASHTAYHTKRAQLDREREESAEAHPK